MPFFRFFIYFAFIILAAKADVAQKNNSIVEPKIVLRSELKSRIAPKAVLKIDFPELIPDRKGSPATCYLTLPNHYDPSIQYPLVVWLGGADGDNQPNKSFLPAGEFILAGLPFPKGANNPAQPNMVGNFGIIWSYHHYILKEIALIIPNIDKTRSIIAGFSNGAHAIDGMLRVNNGPKLSDYFGIFIFAEGGGTPYTSKGNLPNLNGKFAYICWGSEKGSNQNFASQLPSALKSKGAQIVGSEMKGIGHEFPRLEQAKIAKWLEKIAFVKTPTETKK